MARKISSTIDDALFKRAMEITGEGQAETIRMALEHFTATAGGMSRSLAAPPTAEAFAAAAAPQAVAAVATMPVSSMSADEKLACSRLLRSTRNALRASLTYLVGVEAAGNTETKKRLRAPIADLNADIAKLNAQLVAFRAGSLTMAAPSPETVASIGKLAEKVRTMTKEAQKTDLVIDAVVEVVEVWAGTGAD